jgi:hypothetical protein
METMSEEDLLLALKRASPEEQATDGSGRSRFPERGS